MGGVIFGWLALRVLSPDWLSRIPWNVCHYVKRSGEAFTPGGGEAGRAPALHLRPRHLPYN